MKSKPYETVYVNGGEVYKSLTLFELGQNYSPNLDGDEVFPFIKNDGKQYFVTKDFKRHFKNVTEFNVDLEGYDLCPEVHLWCGVGANSQENKQDCDLFFQVDSSEQLANVAGYYGLPYPVDDAVSWAIDFAPDTINWKNASGVPIVLGAVKFIAGVAAVLKLYTYPKLYGTWDVWMYGASYYDGGKCWETGAVFQKETGGVQIPGAQMRGSNSFSKAERILSQRADGTKLSYEYTRGAEDRDPAMFWKGVETLPNGQPGQTKRYESSQTVRRALYRMKSGTTLDNKDLCPAVGIWLGRSYYDDSSEEELFFCIQSREMLDQVAEYYGLPVPYSEEQKAVLDSNLQLYRARHYDLLGLGEGNAVPVVVGAVVVQNGAPVRLLMYTFLRQWEFAEQIELPWISDLLY